MFKQALLRQARLATIMQVEQSPVTITIKRHTLVDDGFGGLMPSPTGTLTSTTHKVRISHEKSSVNALQEFPSGLDSNFELYMLMKHDADIKHGDTFEIQGGTWSVQLVGVFSKFGGVISKQAKIVQGLKEST